ncbi:hypothetical protein HID58_068402 [Brassica napus]|uniref:Uncharacterized protein n=1 Tax=Brassica napus TaxID=3708 RepID=A0ABQ7ZLK3_BRANA|nr:hypothetical protein HID58_068402 [Brassica napus]
MESDKRRQEHPQRREERARPGQAQRTEHGDLRSKILSKREDIAKNVWNRIDHSYGGRNPRDRERYHPYNRDKYEESKHSSRDSGNRSVRGHHGDSVSSSSWRIKGSSPDTRGRNLDQTNKDQHYEHRRMDLSSKSTRNSPDSQRTISESHRYDRGDGAGRRYHSPRQQPRMEWRPTREPGKRRDEQMALSPNQRNVREIARETEDERRRMLKGKAIEANAGDKETNLDTVRAASGILKIFDTVQTEFPGNQVITEKEKEFVTSPERVISLRSPIETGAPSLNRPNLEELDKPTDNEQEMTEEELKEFEEQYASVQLEMDEEMLDNDDLLDETRVEETMVEETMAPEYQTAGTKNLEKQHEDGRVLGGEGKEKREQSRNNLPPRRMSEQGRRMQKNPLPPANLNKRRGTRSPDTKGLAASRKLANRGRASPKGKLAKQGRLFMTKDPGSKVVPRVEVYPSWRNKKGWDDGDASSTRLGSNTLAVRSDQWGDLFSTVGDSNGGCRRSAFVGVSKDYRILD